MTTNAVGRFEQVEQSRGRHAREWEVFVRESVEAPLTHVGSVTADEREAAREQAETLFTDVVAIWLAPEGALSRYTDPDLTPGDGS